MSRKTKSECTLSQVLDFFRDKKSATYTELKELGFSENMFKRFRDTKILTNTGEGTGSYQFSEKTFHVKYGSQFHYPEGTWDRHCSKFIPAKTTSFDVAEKFIENKIRTTAEAQNLRVKSFTYSKTNFSYQVEYYPVRIAPTPGTPLTQVVFDFANRSKDELQKLSKRAEGMRNWELGAYYHQLAESTRKITVGDAMRTVITELETLGAPTHISDMRQTAAAMSQSKHAIQIDKHVSFCHNTGTLKLEKDFYAQKNFAQRLTDFLHAFELGTKTRAIASITFNRVLPAVGIAVSVANVARADTDDRATVAVDETASHVGGLVGAATAASALAVASTTPPGWIATLATLFVGGVAGSQIATRGVGALRGRAAARAAVKNDYLTMNDEPTNDRDHSSIPGIRFGNPGEIHIIPVFRGDTRPPVQIHPKGFTPWGKDMRLKFHFCSKKSGYISTSTSKHVAAYFAIADTDSGYVYAIDPKGKGIHIDEVLGEASRGMKEVVIPYEIKSEDILGSWKAEVSESGRAILKEYTPNPHYRSPIPSKVITGIKVVGHSLTALGLVIDGANLYFAYQRSEETNDSSHITNEATRVAGGWTGAISLGKACASAGVFYLAPLGPWGELVGLVGGGLLGSVAGYLAGSRIAPDVRDFIKKTIVENNLSITPSLIPSLFSQAQASETIESNNSDDKFLTSQLNNLEKEKELQEKFLHSMDLYEAVNIPLPSKLFLVQSSDSTEIICEKIDAYFEDIIRNYPKKTQKLLREMYYDNKNVQMVSLIMYDSTGICFINDSDKKIIVKIEASLSDHPITIRKIKIHEIAVHAGQMHQRINQVGFDAYLRERNNFNKFSEQSVAIVEKILTDALGEVISRELSTARGFVAEMVDYKIYHNQLMAVDDYVHLQHRDHFDKLTPADHELFLRNPQVSSFLSSDAQQFYPNNLGNVVSTEFYRKPLEHTVQLSRQIPTPEYAAEKKLAPDSQPKSAAPAIFSSQLHGETHSSQSATATAEQDQHDSQHDSEEDIHTTQKIEKELVKQTSKVKTHDGNFHGAVKTIGFYTNVLEVRQRTTEKYPKETRAFNAVCSAAQILVEKTVESAGASVGATVGTVFTAGIPNPITTTCGATIGAEAAKPIAKKIGNAVNDGLHYVFGAQKPRAASAHPSRRSTASSSSVPENIQKMYRGETQNTQNKYEQRVSGINSSARKQAESQRKYFAGKGMPEKNVFGQGGGEGIRVHGHMVSNVEFARTRNSNRSERSFFVEFIQSRIPVATASAETHAKSVTIKKSQAQPTSQHSAEYYVNLRQQFLNETISLPAKTTASAQPKTAISHARTNAVTNLRNSTQLSDLKIVLQKTNTALRERQEAAQVAQYNAQRQVEMLSLAGEVCSLASRVCRYCGDGDTAQFFSSTFSLYSSFFALIAAPSPLTVIGLVMNFVGFFISNRAAEEARRFAMMIAAASRSVEGMRDDVVTEIREFQRLAQNEIRLVGAKAAEVLAAQNQLHQSQTQVFSGLAIFQKSLGEYFEKTNAYMHVLATRPLKTACDNLLSYLDNPKKAVSLSLEKIQDYADELEFWITSRLHHRVVNYTVYLDLPASEVISILSSQPHTLLIMPSFVAGRAQIALREKVLPQFLSLPPMMPYFATIRLFYRTLEKHPEFLTDDKCESVFAHIQETLTTFSELLTLLKNNEADIQSCKNMPENERAIIVNMIRAVDLYQAVIAEMKSSITYYQKRLCYLTDPLQQLDMLARESFDKPNSQNGFWKKNEAKSNQAEVCYVISRSHFYDDPQDANTEAVRDSEREFLNKFSRRRIKVVAVTINHEEMFQVILPAKSVPNILPSIPNKCASFFFNSTHQRDLIPEMASSTTRQLQ